jgi:hypothetical protein
MVEKLLNIALFIEISFKLKRNFIKEFGHALGVGNHLMNRIS